MAKSEDRRHGVGHGEGSGQRPTRLRLLSCDREKEESLLFGVSHHMKPSFTVKLQTPRNLATCHKQQGTTGVSK